MSSFEKALLPSIIAAALLGPKQGMPFSRSMSQSPITRGSSGITAAKSISLFSTKSTIFSKSVAAMPVQVTGHESPPACSREIPPFPGSAYIFPALRL